MVTGGKSIQRTLQDGPAMSRNSLKQSLKSLFHRFPANMGNSFWKYNTILHILAMALTFIIVVNDIDWIYFRSSKAHYYLQPFFFPAVIFGGLIPFIAPVIMYIYGRKKKDRRTVNTAFAVGQAAIIGLVISSFYKAVTGRVPPEIFDDLPVADISREFRFGFWRGGIFEGWPSGHTTVAFAMSLTLIMLYPKNMRVRYLALAYAMYIGFGISTNIHWFSDFIAGAFIGTAIGLTVGKSFYGRYIFGSEE